MPHITACRSIQIFYWVLIWACVGMLMYSSRHCPKLVLSIACLWFYISLQEDIEHFADVGSLDDNVESFLSPDDGDGRDLFGTLKRNSSEHAAEASKGEQCLQFHPLLLCHNWPQQCLFPNISGFSFSEVSSIRKSNGKVVCCHFSTDGKLLASAGHDNKVQCIVM